MNNVNTYAERVGQHLAKRIFEAPGRTATVEVHLSQQNLGAFLALAFELGWNHASAIDVLDTDPTKLAKTS